MSESRFPTLPVKRLVPREIVPADAPALLAVHGDAESMRWFGSDPLPDLAAAEALVETFAGWRRQPNPGTRWGIAWREYADRLLGTCGLWSWNRAWRRCTTGYELHPSVRGRGLMDEALRAILAQGFGAMGLNRVEALVHPENAPSLRVLRRLGFQSEGLLREVGYWRGQYHGMFSMALLAREWRATQDAQASA